MIKPHRTIPKSPTTFSCSSRNKSLSLLFFLSVIFFVVATPLRSVRTRETTQRRDGMTAIAGTYVLSELYDEHSSSIPIPPKEEAFGAVKYLELVIEGTDSATATGADEHYRFFMVVGNNLAGSMTVTEGNKIKIGNIQSTMMMPPPKVWEIEKQVSKIFPEVTTLEVDATSLTLEGSGAGKMVFRRRS